jgi:hypothetical protein
MQAQKFVIGIRVHRLFDTADAIPAPPGGGGLNTGSGGTCPQLSYSPAAVTTESPWCGRDWAVTVRSQAPGL